jgi:ArsR family transcriptional regulator
MGTTKSQIFSEEHNRLAAIFRVLANPARIAIMEFLSAQRGCICNDIVDEIGLAQPTISQHLKELKNLGLIDGEIEGTRVCYCIAQEKWLELQAMMTQFFKNTQTTCC